MKTFWNPQGRHQQRQEVRSLEKKFEEGRANKEERSILEKKKTLSETIKARKHSDAFGHIKFVNDDIRIVSGLTNRGNIEEKNNFIPIFLLNMIVKLHSSFLVIQFQ